MRLRHLLLVAVLLVSASCTYPQITQYRLASEPSYVSSCIPYVVQIISQSGGREILGSGVRVGPDKHIVYTANHMISGQDFTFVVDMWGNRIPAHVLKHGDDGADWAILQTEGSVENRVGGLPLWEGKDPEPYSKVLAIGFACGLDSPTATEGRIQTIFGGRVRFTAPIIYGNSGGALIALANGKPTLLGIVYAGHVAGGGFVTHMGLAVDVRSISAWK